MGSLNELLLYDHGMFMSLGGISLLVLLKSFVCVCVYFLVLKFLFQLANRNEHWKYLSWKSIGKKWIEILNIFVENININVLVEL